jgi:hypothetical protein
VPVLQPEQCEQEQKMDILYNVKRRTWVYRITQYPVLNRGQSFSKEWNHWSATRFLIARGQISWFLDDVDDEEFQHWDPIDVQKY